MIIFKEFSYDDFHENVKQIYEKEEWNAYLGNDLKLKRAFDNSLYKLGAFDGNRLIGFIRCVGDGENIVLIQDLIVDNEYRKQGIGSELFRRIYKKYEDVRMFVLITDIADEAANHFYQSFNMKKLEKGGMISYFR